MAGAKSRYYPIEMSKVMDFIKNNEGRYAFVGIPCFIKTARRICRQDPIIAKRIHFFVGLVCGHLKSKAYSDMLAWRAGFDPADMKTIDFRHNLKTAIRMITGSVLKILSENRLSWLLGKRPAPTGV